MFTGRTVTCDQLSRFSHERTLTVYIHECDSCKKNFMNVPKLHNRATGKHSRKGFTHSFCCKSCRYDWAANHAIGGRVKAVYRKSRSGKEVGVMRIYLPKKERHLHSTCDNRGYMYEHRYKMENILGRKLRPEETVHHRDANPFNNEVSNLELRTGQHGCGSTCYTEEVNRLLGMIKTGVDASVFTLQEYAEA